MTTNTVQSKWRPSTRLGWWAVWLMAAFVAMFLINSFVFMPTSSDAPWRQVILPFYGIFMLFSAGVVGLVAITRQRERSWLVWLTILPLAWVLFMLLGEFLVPH
jgi:hypothetical protein